MNYIVFDLEWNQPLSRESEEPRMPFEIIEIGAVKLDSKLNIVDEYSSIVRPRLYKKLQPHIKQILNYDEKFLKSGRPFDVVCREFIKWCGEEEYIFCTWGSMDLYYLQNNMDYYYMRKLVSPLKYINIQQLYADIVSDDGSIVKLEKAVANLNIQVEENRPFHSAVSDAYYTAQVFKQIIPKDIEDRYSYDTYNLPEDSDHEIISYHKGYMEHISRAVDEKTDIMGDKEFMTLRCYKCKKKTTKKIKWFANTQGSYLCVGRCWYHGHIMGKIRFKQTRDEKVFAIKTITPISKKNVEEVKQRQEELRIRRQEKRHNKSKTAPL